MEFLSVAVQEVLKKVVSIAANELHLAWGFRDQLEELRRSLNLISAFLQDELMQGTDDQAAKQWLQRIKDIACDADDVLDDFAYEMLRQKVQHKVKYKVRNFLSKSNPLVLRIRMAHEIQKINHELEKIKSDGAAFGLAERVRFSSGVTFPQQQVVPETHSILDTSKVVVGREEDVAKIINLLLNQGNNDQRLLVVPIVGMAGLGKTTLAKKVFNEIKERKLFDVTMWVCASNKFDELKILGGMLESVGGGRFDNIDPLLTRLREGLWNKKFLLVLDDVWNEDRDKWTCLKNEILLCNECNGNSVLVTTRSEGVAEIMESFPMIRHHPTKLSDDESWKIIKDHAFISEPLHFNLEKVGRRIAMQCGGLPLIAKVIGATMGCLKTEEKWLAIQNSDAWDLARQSKDIRPILQLSFDRLPSISLKQCFAYCAIFPEDFIIEKEKLIQQWIAQGYFRPYEKEISAQDNGNRHFQFLCAISFFQNFKEDEEEGAVYYMMHDCVLDLARYVAGSQVWTYEEEGHVHRMANVRLLNMSKKKDMLGRMGINGSQRLRLLFADIDVFDHTAWNFKSLRALHIEDPNINGLCRIKKSKHLRYLSISWAIIHHLPRSVTTLYHLQTLICRQCALKQLPEDIDNLCNLSYLDVSRTGLSTLPKSFTNLRSLQTVRLISCMKLEKFPDGVGNLVKLKHIYFSQPKLTPARIGQLTSLQTLQLFEVGTEEGRGIEELEGLNRLRGKLQITGLEHVKSKEAAIKANLKGKPDLRELELQWEDREDGVNNDEDVLEGLKPHQNVQSLKIIGFKGGKFPCWYGNHNVLPRLVKLTLIWIENCVELPALSGLPHLGELHVSSNSIRYIGEELYRKKYGTSGRLFPSLKKLSLAYMGSLEEWREPTSVEGGVTLFPCLQELHIMYCPRLKSIPELGCLERLSSLMIIKCGLTYLPAWLEKCKSLERLVIRDCRDLNHPRELTSLGEFDAKQSYLHLERLNYLTSLKDLNIGEFSEESEEFAFPPTLNLPLKSLCIFGWKRLKSLPYQIQHLTSLQELSIWNFDGIEDLPEWLGSLSSLQHLRVNDCKNLRYLPSAEAMKHLRDLEIFGSCDELKERCKEAGPEWPKISHIPRHHIP